VTGQALAGGAENKGQPLVWSVLSTALLAGILWWTMGWVWALAGIAGVFVHEFGHVLAMNALGAGPARIHIIPFLGGAAVPARAPDTEFKDVVISLCGPSFGLLAALPFLGAHLYTGETFWLEGALFVAIINLINLLPAPPLDGSHALGPALARIHPWVERAALLLVAAGVVLWALQSGRWILAAFVGIFALGALRRRTLRPEAARLTAAQWPLSVALYLLTVSLCVAVFWFTLGQGGVQADLRGVLGHIAGL
jgi:Zn-dependent protease